MVDMVYIVWYDNGEEYEDYREEITGVYTTQELAQWVADRMNEHRLEIRGYHQNAKFYVASEGADVLPLVLQNKQIPEMYDI